MGSETHLSYSNFFLSPLFFLCIISNEHTFKYIIYLNYVVITLNRSKCILPFQMPILQTTLHCKLTEHTLDECCYNNIAGALQTWHAAQNNTV